MDPSGVNDGPDGAGTSTSQGDPPHPSAPPAVDAARVWAAVEKASFAIIGHLASPGHPRTSGVVYAAQDHHLWFAVAPDSWKARCIRDGDEVAVTVLVRRGGLLSLLLPIPPATISYHTRAIVHQPGTLDLRSVSRRLASLVPAARRDQATIIELVPEGSFLTYGIGVSLRGMADPALALAHVPTGA